MLAGLPDPDVKRLWRMLLPDTPFPGCGTAGTCETEARQPAAIGDGRDDPEPRPQTADG